jgi:ABC-type transport system involved in multi-copper enzyme maturation permease subunit
VLILVGILVGLFYALNYVIFALGNMTEAETSEVMVPEAIMSVGIETFEFTAFILAVVVASGLIGAEYDWNTLRPLVARTRSRSALLSAKWVTVVLVTVLITVVGVASAILYSILGSTLIGAEIGVSEDLLVSLLKGIVFHFVALLPYPVIAFSVALLTRSNAAGIAVGVGMRFTEPLVLQLLGSIAKAMQDAQQWGIAWNVQQLNSFASNHVSSGELWRSIAVLIAYCSILIIATYLVFTRRDITSG